MKTLRTNLSKMEEHILEYYNNPEYRERYEALARLPVEKAVAEGDGGLHPYWLYQVAYMPSTKSVLITDFSEAGMWVGGGVFKHNKEISEMSEWTRKFIQATPYEPVYRLPGYLLLKALVKSNPDLVIEFPGPDLMFSRTVDDMREESVSPKVFGVDEKKRRIPAKKLLEFWDYHVVRHLKNLIP